MKDINGNDLQQPYYDLAVMRREQQKDSKWAKTYDKEYAEVGMLVDAFEWNKTPANEKGIFWSDVFNNKSPTIPDTSLDELEAWRREKRKSKFDVIHESIKAIPIEERRKIAKQVQEEMNPTDRKDPMDAMLDAYFNQFTDEQLALMEHKIDAIFSRFKPADSTDWQAKYAALKTKYDELNKRYLDLLEIQQREAKHGVVELTTEPSNFIVECAMMAMQVILGYTIGNDGDAETEIAIRAFDYAEAMAAEGKKRGHI